MQVMLQPLDYRKDPRRAGKACLSHPSELHRLIPTLRPNPLTILVKQPWNRQHGHRDEAKQARRPAHPQALIHLERKQREYSAERVARHAIRCHR